MYCNIDAICYYGLQAQDRCCPQKRRLTKTGGPI